MTQPAGDLISGETNAMLGFTLTPPNPVVGQQSMACGAMDGCKALVEADATAMTNLTTFMTAANDGFDAMMAAARRSGHEYLAADEQSRIAIDSVLPPEGK